MNNAVIAFAKAAFDHAEKALENTLPHQLSTFSVAGETVGICETTPQLSEWITGQFDPAASAPTFRVYCDYTGWHRQNPALPNGLHRISPLEMDNILAASGFYGSYYPPNDSWDLFDPARKLGVRLQPAVNAYAEWEPTAPLANFLNWIMRAKGRHVLHAATLGAKGRGVLLVGPGGSGKSGTTLAGVRFGLESVGDDYCVISPGAKPIARPFYRCMKQDPEGLARVGLTGGPAFGPLNWQGKYVFDLRKPFPQAAVDRLDLKAILLPHIEHTEKTTLKPARSFEALQALAPSTMLQLVGDRAAAFSACAEIVRSLPCYHLMLGEDPQEIAEAIIAFIRKDTP